MRLLPRFPRQTTAFSGFGKLVLVMLVACALLGQTRGEENDIAKLTAIEDEKHAAEILSASAGQMLMFDSLAQLSPAAAEVLARHDADIALHALTKLDADLAAAFSEFRHTLGLHGIEQLDDAAAAALAEGKAVLSLENLRSLTHVGLAEKIAAQPFLVTFKQLEKVEPAIIADTLAAGACGLALPAIVALNHQGLAQKLVSDGQKACVFEKLTKLGPAAAKGLCGRPCNLHFKALKAMPPNLAAEFANHVGVLDVDRLVKVHPEAAVSLLGNRGPLDLGGCDGFVNVGQPVPQPVLAAVAGHRSALTLGDLNEVPADLADAIRQRTHHTVLPDVRCVTVVLAQGLAGNGGVQGVVWLTNTEQVEPPDAVHAGAVPMLLRMKPVQALPGPLGQPAVILSSGLRSRLPDGHTQAIENHFAVHFGNQLGP